MSELTETTLDQPQGPSVKYSEVVEKAGVPLRVSEKVLSTMRRARAEDPHDELTGLPIENQSTSQILARRLATAVRNGEQFACIYADADNLKSANTIHRDLGDAIIRADAARVSSMIEELDLPEDVEFYLLRQTGAADETVVWMFNLGQEDLEKARKATEVLNNTRTILEVPTKGGTKNFTMSTTAAMIDSQTPFIQEQIKANPLAIPEQAQGQNDEPMGLFETIKTEADDQTKMQKIAKDILRLNIEELSYATCKERVREILVETLGDSRISKPLLDTTLGIMQDETLLGMLSDPEQRAKIISSLGMDINGFDERTFDMAFFRSIYFDNLVASIRTKYDNARPTAQAA